MALLNYSTFVITFAMTAVFGHQALFASGKSVASFGSDDALKSWTSVML